MKRKKHSPQRSRPQGPASLLPPWPPLAALALALTGQVLMVRSQSAWTLPLSLLFFGAALYPAALHVRRSGNVARGPFSFFSEPFFLFWVLALAFFFRTYRLDRIPSGIAKDEAYLSVAAQSALAGNGPSFFDFLFSQEGHSSAGDGFLGLMAWYHLVPATKLGFCSFFVLVSLASLCFLYPFFRWLTGPFPALIGLFFLAVPQWEVGLDRNGHPANLNLFFMAGCLFFFQWGWKRRILWPFAAASLFLGAGLYGYPAFKAFPLLLVILFAVEGARGKDLGSFRWKAPAALFLPALVWAAPLLAEMVRHGRVLAGPSEYDAEFIGVRMVREGSLDPLLDNLFRLIRALFRTGDPTPTYSFPGAPLLDGAWGILIGFGLLAAFLRFREKGSLPVLAGLGVMALPALLSDEPDQCTHLFLALPFMALLAGWGLEVLAESFPNGSFLARSLTVLFLAWSFGQNYLLYFHDRPQDLSCWKRANTASNLVGERIREGGDSYEYLLSPAFYGNYSNLYQSFALRALQHPLVVPDGYRRLPQDPRRGLCFLLERGQSGWLGLVQTLYPGGVLDRKDDPIGQTALYLYTVDADLVRRSKVPFLSGLTASYRFVGERGEEKRVQKEPLINFSSRADFPVEGFQTLDAEWSGRLQINQAGLHHFLILTDDQAQGAVRGTVFREGEEKAMDLKKGVYPFTLHFEKKTGFNTSLHFLWKTPGSDHYEVVPFGVFVGGK